MEVNLSLVQCLVCSDPSYAGVVKDRKVNQHGVEREPRWIVSILVWK